MELSGLTIGALSVGAILLFIYLGMHVAVALALSSFLALWVLKGDIELPMRLFVLAAGDSISSYAFAVVPLFVLMGYFVDMADLGRDAYAVANSFFRRLRGGLGIATVAANAVFAAITGISIASAAIFTRIAVPEMIRFGYGKRFAVGVVAGSSVLGMLIPPSVLLIVYAIIAQQSVAALFTAAIVPGLILTFVYCAGITLMAVFLPHYVGGPGRQQVEKAGLGWLESLRLIAPIVILIVLVLGGIYGGVFTPTEAGAAGAALALIIAALRKRLTPKSLWRALMQTGQVTAAILFLIICASMYSRMLGITGVPSQLSAWITQTGLSFAVLLTVYVVLIILAGTIIDSTSIILIAVPVFLPILQPLGIDPVWFGIVTVLGAEIGLLTPPLGISVFVVKGALEGHGVSLRDIFIGAAPFAAMMLLVLILIIVFPSLASLTG